MAKTISFTATTLIGRAPLEVQFNCTYDEIPIIWEWNFGDGVLSNEENPLHYFSLEGKYTIVLSVTFSDGTLVSSTKSEYIIVDKPRTVPHDICLRYATEQNEGIGWSKYGGESWIEPMGNYGVFQVLDSNKVPRNVLFDKNDFRIYEIGTCDRVVYVKQPAVDKEFVENTEIVWEKWEGLTIFGLGEEDKTIKHENSFIKVAPADLAYRGASGYTASGQRENQELSLSAYLNGEQISAAGIARDFPENGEVVFSGRKVSDIGVQMVVSGTAGEIFITGHKHIFLAEMKSPGTDRITMSEHVIQKELATGKVLHLSRGRQPLLNRVTGTLLTGGVETRITGPDGRERSAVNFTQNVVLDNPVITSDYTIIVWSKTPDPFAYMTQYGDPVNGWCMYYKKLNIGLAASIILLAGDRFDVRIYSKQISDTALARLYEDVVSHEGKMLLPGF